MNPERRLAIAELSILGLTLAATLGFGSAVYWQTSRHFALQRSTDFVHRFNEHQLVSARHTVDEPLGVISIPGNSCRVGRNRDHTQWLASGESPESLYQRANSEAAEISAPAKQTVKSIRTFANFFQELGTAMKHQTLEEAYAWDVFGSPVKHYMARLRSFIEETRARRSRKKLYQEAYLLETRMAELDSMYDEH